MKNIPVIREIDQSELLFLDDMLNEAIFIPEGVDKLSRDIIKHPDLYKYIKDFGQIGDICLVAELQGKLVGAIWTRIFSENDKGYGFVDKDTPELSMALYEEYRHKGIGKILLKEMIHKLTEQGYRQVSLSVDKQNYAYGFYKRNGFKKHESTDKSVTMIKKLNENNGSA